MFSIKLFFLYKRYYIYQNTKSETEKAAGILFEETAATGTYYFIFYLPLSVPYFNAFLFSHKLHRR